MSEKTSIFGADNPFQLIRSWMAEAEVSEPNDPNAISLATVDENGMPNVRVVLLKEIEESSFVFYTNYRSVKGQELEASGKAAFNLYWKTLGRQIRVRGIISKEDTNQADRYFASRDLGSRWGAWASQQSQPLKDRATLMAQVEDVRERFGENVPRPSHWGGYRLTPHEIEFWQAGDSRLHDREVWKQLAGDNFWEAKRLSP
ncbi:pyridoxamine 5'-phosphate oxidase [Palleronia caenipelagi]|uniref:Pyridoxine/pyridoxamine 5'-phosphate oxidase n=1 Tax=Palleronia caenipelagi TaxID=2489174 RepID=A0A547QB53_9RHOB|nr:pyridoxamine 5'-phosphate oxidase [Palleronia caenipelagi]TRD23619.1 pyridoxamine 5'-phosphate oxidase [Palleronia caenipelagi]